jgi:hypothetical protein
LSLKVGATVNLSYDLFSEIDLSDSFFDSLRQDYPGFDAWFKGKGSERAYVARGDNAELMGFLYLKNEQGAVTDIEPALPERSWLKIGTFKIDAHGTRLGERFMKKVFDHALAAAVSGAYVTIFPKHVPLVDLFCRYGFKNSAVKNTPTGQELVLVREFEMVSGTVVSDYPFFQTADHNYALLAIYPEWHTRLFPDSKLVNEPPDIVKDVSHTNSIHKIYLCKMDGVLGLETGDVLIIYRTKDPGSTAPAHYTSVATSVCVVEETRHVSSFSSLDEFLAYTRPYSVFTDTELKQLFKSRRYPIVLRFTYNAAFKHSVTRAELLGNVGLPADAYYGFLPISRIQLKSILSLGKINENLTLN